MESHDSVSHQIRAAWCACRQHVLLYHYNFAFCFLSKTICQLSLCTVSLCTVNTAKDRTKNCHLYCARQIVLFQSPSSKQLSNVIQFRVFVADLDEHYYVIICSESNLQRYPNQNLSPGPNQPYADDYPANNFSAGWQNPGRFDYNDPVNADRQAPEKPPRHNSQPTLDYNGQNHATNDVPAPISQPRRSVYPYQPRDTSSSANRVQADAGYSPAIVPDSLDGLYSKVVKPSSRPNERPNLDAGQRSGIPPSRYDRPTSTNYGSDPFQDVGQNRDQHLPNKGLDSREFTGRDYNFNVAQSSPYGRDNERRSYHRGERHLDGTPMFGDVRKEMGHQVDAQPVQVRNQNRREFPSSSQQQMPSPLGPSQRRPDGSFFQYPPAGSSSQVSSCLDSVALIRTDRKVKVEGKCLFAVTARVRVHWRKFREGRVWEEVVGEEEEKALLDIAKTTIVYWR